MLSAESFDLTNGAVVLRLVCALFFIPHMYFKVAGNPPPASKTFIEAGYPNPLLWVRIALVVEITVSVFLVLDIYTHLVALVCACILMVAAASLFFANDKKWLWLWPKGGVEYAVFWALCCVALSLLYWR